MAEARKLIVTGASGVLGAAVYDAFRAAGWDTIGLARSRVAPGLTQLDLLDQGSVEALFQQLTPQWVIHCAAERRPDVAEKDEIAAEKLNAGVPRHLAILAVKYNFRLVYISTDYVFDGRDPEQLPYKTNAKTNPLQLYGRTKRDGERAVLEGAGDNGTVLRVPILYGPAPKNSDTAVNIMLDVVQDQSGKKYAMDHVATRFPTNIHDIARFLVVLTDIVSPLETKGGPPAASSVARTEPSPVSAGSSGVSLPPILHFSAQEPFTKYEICLEFAKILDLSADHIIPVTEVPEDATPRPVNTRLDILETEQRLGITLDCSGFVEWWIERLKGSSAPE